jgi:pyruvate dehydrogenase (quinone)/pyruvate oxidase
MGRIASEALVERLADWGVDTVFGLPGDGINGIMEGLRRHSDRIRFVLGSQPRQAVRRRSRG